MRPHFSWPAFLLLSAQLIRPSLTLLDSGTPPAAEDSASGGSISSERHDRVHVGASPVASAGSVVVRDAEQVGLRPGCRRSTDFFDHVCSNPSRGSEDAARQSASSSLAPGVTADLLVCDLPDVEPLIRPGSDDKGSERRPSATYAVSGTIVVQEAAGNPHSEVGRLPELGTLTSPVEEGPGEVAAASSISQPDASYPGPGDEGFWRQRDGQHEWHPTSDQASQNSHSGQGDGKANANNARNPSQAENPALGHPDATHTSEYDAWSAEQEQGAFLSFKEWKERHAESHPGQAREAKPNASLAQAKSAKASPASLDPTAPSRQTDTYVRARDSSIDRHSQQSSSEHQTAPSSGFDSSTDKTASTAPAPGHTGQAQASGPEETNITEPPTESPDSSRTSASSGPQVASSVSAGDTGSQLSKLKHRWNFASLDCAAVVHRTNPEAKFASSILSEKKDRYMLSPCPRPGSKLKGGSQFVIVELCEEIKIDTLVLANYEFFSNMFKKFTVTAARQLTGRESDWTQLGVFRARNIRGQQVFRIPSAPRSEAFFRYIRIDFLEHFGSEFYCPVSLLRVYGITEMEEYKREFEERDGEMDAISESFEADTKIPQDVMHSLPSSAADVPQVEAPQTGQSSLNRDATVLAAQDEDIWRKHEQAFQRKLQNQSQTLQVPETEAAEILLPQSDNASAHAASSTSGQSTKQTSPGSTSKSQTTAIGDDDKAQCAPEDDPAVDSEKSDRCVQPLERARPFHQLEVASRRGAESKHLPLEAGSGSNVRPNSVPESLPVRPSSASEAAGAAEHDADRGRRANAQRSGGASSPQHGSPGSESVYRAIHRRLSALESNATLSHSYIEHSGQMLREVFARMEKRQEIRMSDMLRLLNASNWQQIESLKRRQQVDLQRAIFEFDVHRQQADNERRALLREVQILAEEVLLEKRLSIAQLIMLLAVFVFVGLTRGSRTVPLLHAGFTRIGRSSKRSEGRTAGNVVIPASPNRATARLEQKLDVAQPQISPVRKGVSTQPPQNPRTASSANVASAAQHPRPHLDRGNTSVGSQPLALGSSNLNNTTNPKHAMRNDLRGSNKLALNRGARRAIPREESLIDMLSNPRAGIRLLVLLKSLDSLNRAADRRRLSRYSTQRRGPIRRQQAGDKALSAALAIHSGQYLGMLPSSDIEPRASRTHRAKSSLTEDRYVANSRRHGAPGRVQDKGAFELDDLAGTSSDWTERSENGEASEHAAYLSEDEDNAIRAARADHLSLDPNEDVNLNINSGGIGGKKVSPRESSMDAPVRAAPKLSVSALAQPPLGVARADEHVTAVAPELPGIAKADGHLSSSDSESEGGAWHRVLPRRIGHSNSLRRARQTTMDGQTPKNDSEAKPNTKTEASDRRGSPRPSSAHGTPFKSGKPAFNRFFRAGTPDHTGLEAPQKRRSGTPDTIRDVRFV